jgi:outer membrane protein
MRLSAVFLLVPIFCFAETRTMTLRQALDLAMQQNPDVVLAQLDQQKARYQVTIAQDPFSPKVFAGSGAAYTYGFPTSIDGNAPSILESKTQMAIFDRSQSYTVAQAKESLRGAGIDIASRQEEVAFRVASLFLDAEYAARSFTAAQRQAETLAHVQQLVQSRVDEGRELKLEASKATLAIKKIQHQVNLLNDDVTNAETSLALALGLTASDRIRPAEEDRSTLETPASEEAALEAVLENSPELKRLESNLQAKTLEIKSNKAKRLPTVGLVAQYSLLGGYNRFQQYFTSFQHNNLELGASFSIPVLAGHAARAYVSQGEADAAKIRAQVAQTRGRIETDLRRAYQDVQRADEGLDLARADLSLARDQVSLDLAQVDEGKLPQAKLEQDRATEDEKWMAYYQSQTASERARLSVLRVSGTLLTAVK